MRLEKSFMEAKFVRKINRFVYELDLGNKLIKARMPNTGRLAEYNISDQIFYVSPQENGKLDYKIISARKVNDYVMLDTIKMNRVFYDFLSQKLLTDFNGFFEIKREYAIHDSKFDFLLRYEDQRDKLIEIKSCSWFFKDLAMFPDAPSDRALKHLNTLAKLSEKYDVYCIYLIPYYSAKRFIPDMNIDYHYAKAFQKYLKIINFKALAFQMTDPVTINVKSIHEAVIDIDQLTNRTVNTGAYLLLLCNETDQKIFVGKTEYFFQKGYYVYVGAAMNNLEKRVHRHSLKRKAKHWHIDYICPYKMKLKHTFLLRNSIKEESIIAEKISLIAKNSVIGFGASDAKEKSHLFYFDSDPRKTKVFWEFYQGLMV